MSHISTFTFEEGLKKLSMLRDDDEETGLYFLDRDIDNPHIKIHIEEAKQYEPIAIYVTKFENNSAKPQIYIYDNTSNEFDEKKIAQLHKQLWNAYKVPMFFLFSKTEVKIYNCLEKPHIEKQDLQNISPLKSIKLASKISKEFKANMFDTGAFWSSSYKENFLFKNSVYESLLDELKLLRDNLLEQNILSNKTAESLLIKSIFLRYLEERGVFDKIRLLTKLKNLTWSSTPRKLTLKDFQYQFNEFIRNEKPYWDKFKKGATSFIDIFDDTKAVIDLLDDLNRHFNGGVFDIGNENSEEREELLGADLKEFKYFLEGKKDGKQLVFWSRYSFKDLPIELISNIYELFLKSEDKEKGGIVYTPPILVNFMIDEIMPLEKPQKDFKLIDPSCGSGIFLVGAYKRLIDWWRIDNEWKKPTTEIAKGIIRDSIFGVDKEDGAIQVSIFSLSLALCDTFLPDVIWNDLTFDNLQNSKNIISQDFFEYIQDESNHNKFDLVIGNPPFVSGSDTVIFKELEKKESKIRPRVRDKILKLPDKQLALFFLEQSFTLLKDNAYLSMVQHAPPFLYNDTKAFRNYLFEKYQCHQIIDFSGLKKLFNTANVAVAVAFMQKKKPDIQNDEILHLTVRETFFEKEKKYFDLSHYDFHWLRYNDVLEQKSIWKCNLMGGGRIKSIIQRLDSHRIEKLGEYLTKKEKNNWFFAEGYQEGKIEYRTKEAPWITGHKMLPPEAFTEDGIDDTKLVRVKDDSKFQWSREKNKKIFEPPHLLIKKQISKNKILSEYRDDYLTFKNTIFGIHAPQNEKKELLKIEEYLKVNSSMLLFYLVTTSSRVLIYRATSLLQKDILGLPYLQEGKNVKLSKTEEYFADDTLNFMLDYIKNNDKKSPLLKPTTPKQLEEFQSVYCELLNSTYDDIKPFKTFETDSFIGCSFYYKDKPTKSIFENSKDLDDDLYSIINNKIGQNVNIKRILRFYDENVIYIIKPKEYRFWLKSIAVRDADETYADLVEMGY